jgi:hypothetical protein
MAIADHCVEFFVQGYRTIERESIAPSTDALPDQTPGFSSSTVSKVKKPNDEESHGAGCSPIR